MKKKMLIMGLDSAPAEIVFDRRAELLQRRPVAAILGVGLVGVVRVGEQADAQDAAVEKADDARRGLQEVERQLAELRRDREAKMRRLEFHQRQLKKAEDKLQENQSTVRDRQKRLDTLQLDMAVREESISKHRQALNKAKTNREYAAILTVMNTEKADNTRAEGGKEPIPRRLARVTRQPGFQHQQHRDRGDVAVLP